MDYKSKYFFKKNNYLNYKSKFIKDLPIDQKANLQDKDEDIDDALLKACKQQKIEVVRLLLENGADCNRKKRGINTPLIEACDRNNLEIVRLLLHYGADINQQNGYGHSALLIACRKQNIKLVHFLIENNADCNLKDITGRSSLQVACWKGNLEIIRLLLENGANVNDFLDIIELLLEESINNLKEIIILLLQNGANINQFDSFYTTPLIIACRYNSIDIVRFLLENGADINQEDNLPTRRINTDGTYRDTPLLIACKKNSIDLMLVLLKNGTSFSQVSNVLNDTSVEITSRNNLRDLLTKLDFIKEACETKNLELVISIFEDDANRIINYYYFDYYLWIASGTYIDRNREEINHEEDNEEKIKLIEILFRFTDNIKFNMNDYLRIFNDPIITTHLKKNILLFFIYYSFEIGFSKIIQTIIDPKLSNTMIKENIETYDINFENIIDNTDLLEFLSRYDIKLDKIIDILIYKRKQIAIPLKLLRDHINKLYNKSGIQKMLKSRSNGNNGNNGIVIDRVLVHSRFIRHINGFLNKNYENEHDIKIIMNNILFPRKLLYIE